MLRIANDKKIHFIGGAVLGAAFSLVVYPAAGFLIAAVIGIAKEVFRDWLLKMGTPEVMDAVATIAGGAVGTLAVMLLR